PRPVLSRHGLRDHTAVLGDVVEAGSPAAILADRVGADEAGALSRRHVVVGLAEPIDAVVLHPRTELLFQPFDVVVAEKPTQVAITMEGRIANDDVRVGPSQLERVPLPAPR